MSVRIEHDADSHASLVEGTKKLFIKSYGCQMNVYDAIRMGELMRPHGYHVVETAEDADLIVLNTCHIREKADDKLFSDIGRFNKQGRKDALYAVGGCVGQAMGRKVIQRSPRVQIVFGPQTFHRLPEFVMKAKKSHMARVVDTEFPELEKFDVLPSPGAYGPTAFVSVQEGCDKFCTYCVVPYTRGAEISRSVQAVEDECRLLVEQGVKEVTLLGQNVNAYHGANKEGPESGLAGLIRRLAKMDGLERIRFTTSHPVNMDDDLIALFGEEEKMMPYLHLPVQAGSDKILKAMNRNHTAQSYINTIEQLREVRPDIAISGDFIVGFPGETEEDYLETLAVVAEVNYSSAYSFAYSARPGTPAASMAGQVADVDKKERLAGLQALLDDQQQAFNDGFVGKTVNVLVEGHGKDKQQLRGRNEHNLVVNMEGHARLIGHNVRVKIIKAKPKSLFGEIELVS